MLRYDGRSRSGTEEQEFFVVIPLEDVAKLPDGVLDLEDEKLGGPAAFFRETATGPALYLEQEANTAPLRRLRDCVAEGQIKLIDCIGDLRAMGAPDAMDAPDFAAFEENEFEAISREAAVGMIASFRQARQDAQHDHSSLSGPC